MAKIKIKDMPIGARVCSPGSSEAILTGDWRSYTPVVDKEKCINCLNCWMFCPDNSVIIKEGRLEGFKMSHCKGCGICAQICPKKAITMTEA
ncbi:MAG: 4Fe-4S binding protein [Candidatus Methanomethylophilaceae archaeon]|jgi:pyruvate ferredoxin oxidoreductase delta subunit|nr:4Fe-4S binding protein [Candidatus Methanomethylophilaceae archaeon]NCA74399.1 4Fe-4S dicluster domain-containing protein [Gammaproteobacteria bacterium]MDD3351512.1 4Fe-4S binding protein [Candidatus Methanomethylophilaceae archaeon]MDD3986479.1 4Fe-4S binding protein [Candidatus Methanomethylophilaceae archaeon]MDD4708755.1 4Fe-4S binding protein [Candidatus Methanomethylophilaceae archaeon]